MGQWVCRAYNSSELIWHAFGSRSVSKGGEPSVSHTSLVIATKPGFEGGNRSIEPSDWKNGNPYRRMSEDGTISLTLLTVLAALAISAHFGIQAAQSFILITRRRSLGNDVDP